VFVSDSRRANACGAGFCLPRTFGSRAPGEIEIMNEEVAAAGGRFYRIAETMARVVSLALLPWLVCAAEAAEPITINVVMIDYRFQPDHLTLQHGVLYRLHLENHGKETHEFTAPTFFAASKIDNPEVLNREHSEIVMQPGDVKDLLVTPGPPGTYDLRCADHDWDGMTGGITVQ
jgi:uncharacterized cupredoxin-like copper-binding protein